MNESLSAHPENHLSTSDLFLELIVRKCKYDGRIKSEWQGELLSLHVPEWLLVLHHPTRHLKFSGKRVEHSEQLFIHCLNTVHPLTVLLEYNRTGQFTGAKCDAALPATQDENVIKFVDLDLDIIVEPDAASWLRDEKTFAQNRWHMGYPETVVEQAWAGIALARALLAESRFPFDARLVPQLAVHNATL